MNIKRARGFTLLELLLSIAIISSLAGLSLPVYRQFQIKNDVEVAATTTAQTLRRAQTLSQSVQLDDTWGVYVQSGSITLFVGPSYAGRDTSYDELFDVPTTISRSGLQEIVFDRLTGEPQVTGSITFTSVLGDTQTVILNDKGTVSY
ncbi:MAG: type II secretion system protein [bacterium]|nr:type II secretion system protein [bacterium]